jgi:hypothetical protein
MLNNLQFLNMVFIYILVKGNEYVRQGKIQLQSHYNSEAA